MKVSIKYQVKEKRHETTWNKLKDEEKKTLKLDTHLLKIYCSSLGACILSRVFFCVYVCLCANESFLLTIYFIVCVCVFVYVW